jgi:biotin synthase-like enzyme
MVRAIAVARLVMPKTVVRLSAGRVNMSPADQAMCFLAGANSVFTGGAGKHTLGKPHTHFMPMTKQPLRINHPNIPMWIIRFHSLYEAYQT